ncbi:pseudaminic acid cytidylyltransferase [uncultured Microbulbifer sp.]|uniref:pseudaminic acid cytidylyltransferase n=1 Tax=uncultured Microbulbifer sp. TaxID=348147 RepID=UPI00262BC48E|nr:pseudaminic acid cytidylyltransferase [uncultured Microbulbifer sp.]
MKFAVIPARGGSKRIPRKNIKIFGGQPMIAWSIETARNSGCFDQVIVSTDDSEIAEIAVSYGAKVPFIRPAELSDDFTGTIPVVRHAIEWLQSQYVNIEYLCCIYATAPFLSVKDIDKGLQLLINSNANYVFSVTSYAFPIQRAVRMNDSGRIEMVYPKHFGTRSQDLERVYHDAGQFYWGKAKAWLEEKVIFSSNTIPICLPRYRVQDIDTPEDWERAEIMFRVARMHDRS